MSRGNGIGWRTLGLALALFSAASAAEVVAVVSAKSAVTALTKNQVADIFLGRASRFPDGEQALPVDQAEGSTAREEFYSTYAGRSPPQIKAHWAKIIFTGRGHPPQEVANGAELKKLLDKNINAIGYIERSSADGAVRVLRVE
jgi:ABC-type phosphate transport system substrate-binding protein